MNSIKRFAIFFYLGNKIWNCINCRDFILSGFQRDGILTVGIVTAGITAVVIVAVGISACRDFDCWHCDCRDYGCRDFDWPTPRLNSLYDRTSDIRSSSS